MFLLPHSEDRMILLSFVWIEYQRLTDGRTDGRNCNRYYRALHCQQFGRSVKTIGRCQTYHFSASYWTVVQNRLQYFLDSSDLSPRSQSAYCQYHSTESQTAVTKVYNDMLPVADGGQVTNLNQSTRLDSGLIDGTTRLGSWSASVTFCSKRT